MKLKIGDRVKCVNTASSYGALTLNKVYIVDSFNCNETEVYVREEGSSTRNGGWMVSRFEKVKPSLSTIEEKIKFAEELMGKRVKSDTAIGKVYFWGILKRGDTSSTSVEDVAEKDGYCVYVKYDCYTSPVQNVELVDDFEEIKLNSNWTAKVYDDRVEVGCQSFNNSVIEDLYKLIQKRKN